MNELFRNYQKAIYFKFFSKHTKLTVYFKLVIVNLGYYFILPGNDTNLTHKGRSYIENIPKPLKTT